MRKFLNVDSLYNETKNGREREGEIGRERERGREGGREGEGDRKREGEGEKEEADGEM